MKQNIEMPQSLCMAWLDKKNVSYFLCILRLVRIHESTKIFQTSFDFSPILLHLVLDTVWVYSSEKIYLPAHIGPVYRQTDRAILN